MHTLAISQGTASFHSSDYRFPKTVLYQNFNLAIVQENPMARLEALVYGRNIDQDLTRQSFAGSHPQANHLPFNQFDTAIRKGAGAHLGAGQIHQDSDGSAALLGRCPHLCDPLSGFLFFPMAEIDARNRKASINQFANAILRSGTDGGDNFCEGHLPSTPCGG